MIMNQKEKTYVGIGVAAGTSALVAGIHVLRKKMRVHRDRKYIKNFVSHHTGHNQYLIDTVDQLSNSQVEYLSQLIRESMNQKEQMKALGNSIDQKIHHIITEIENCVKETEAKKEDA